MSAGTVVSSQAYTYDGFGRRILNQETVYQDVPASGYTAQQTWRYAYDPLDRVTAAYLKPGSAAESLYTAHRYDAYGNLKRDTYAYDHAGRRIGKTVAGTSGYTANYLYDGPDVHAVYQNGWTTATNVYTHGPGDDDILMIQAAGLPARYQHADGLGSVVMQTGASALECHNNPSFSMFIRTPSSAL